MFFAPLVFRERDTELHARLLAALQDSRMLVLLWSRYVSNSQWVSLETSIFATLPTPVSEQQDRAVIVIDLDGPRLPGWLRYHLVLRPDQESQLERLVHRPDSISEFTRDAVQGGSVGQRLRARIMRATRLGRSALFDLADWEAASRAPLFRLGPDVSLAQIRLNELRKDDVRQFIGDALIVIVGGSLAIGVVAWILGAWLLAPSYIIDFRGYVRKEVLLVACVSAAAGLTFAVRVSLVGGVAASLASAICGSLFTLTMGWIGRPGPMSGGLAAGVALGACAATTRAANVYAGANERPRGRFHWGLPAGLGALVGLVVASQWLIAVLTAQLNVPGPLARAGVGLLVGALLFVIVGGIAGWVAHRQLRLYFWRSAALVGLGVWVAMSVATALVAAAVPFGDPFNPLDGIGVGLLTGAAVAGATTLLVQGVETVVRGSWSVPIAAALLLLVAYPLLLRFENINAAVTYGALLVGAIAAFFSVFGAQASGPRARRAGVSDSEPV